MKIPERTIRGIEKVLDASGYKDYLIEPIQDFNRDGGFNGIKAQVHCLSGSLDIEINQGNGAGNWFIARWKGDQKSGGWESSDLTPGFVSRNPGVVCVYHRRLECLDEVVRYYPWAVEAFKAALKRTKGVKA